MPGHAIVMPSGTKNNPVDCHSPRENTLEQPDGRRSVPSAHLYGTLMIAQNCVLLVWIRLESG